MLIDLDYLRTVHIADLSRAARAVGLSWKSGTLSKADIIDRLSRYPAMASAAVAVLKRENTSANGRVTFRPASPQAKVSDWLDSDEGEQTPPKAGVVAPTALPPSAPLIDLSAYALKSELQAQGEGFNHRLSASVRALADLSTHVRRENSAIRAELGRALNDYTLAGGSVSLFLHYIGFLRAGPIDSIRGAIIRMRAPTADLAQLSLGCSVAAFRAVSGPLITALSDSRRDTIPVPQAIDNPLPASIYLGGRTETGDIGPSLTSTLEALAVR